MGLQYEDQKALGFYDLSEILQYIPNFITFLRIVALPHLVYAFNNQIILGSYLLFLFSIGTDLIDGFVARKLNLVSRFGGYFDLAVDFLFISGMYLNFVVKGIYSPWILVIIIGVFTQFVISNLIVKETVYDPIGKYYGSLLFGGIGLTILFSNQLIYDVVTFGIIFSTVISLTSRLTFFIKKKKANERAERSETM